MAAIVIRGMDESVKQALASQAEEHGRSMEAEARMILARGVQRGQRNLGVALLETFSSDDAADDLELPDRDDEPRAAVFEE